jgi:hypothetical protein
VKARGRLVVVLVAAAAALLPRAERDRLYAPASARLLGYGLFRSLAQADVTTDGDGHRRVPGAPLLAAHTLHLIGDAEAFGWHLADDDTVAAQLQRRLGSGWRVVNHGVPGYGPLAYAEELLDVPADDFTLVLQSERDDLREAYDDSPSGVVRCGFLVPRGFWSDHIPCFLRGAALFAAMRSVAQTPPPVPLGFDEIGRAAAEVLARRIANRYRAAEQNRPGRVLYAVVPWDALLVPARRRAFVRTFSPVERRVSLPANIALERAFAAHPDPSLLFAPDGHLSARGAAFVADTVAPAVARLLVAAPPPRRP